MSMTEQQIKIVAEPAIDPNICRFKVDRPVAADRSVACRSREAASGAPLLEALFAIDGVREVLISHNIVTVAKAAADSWPELGKKIGAAIRGIMESDQPPVPSDWQVKARSDNQLQDEIQKLFDTRVNPGIKAHGGQVELVEVKDSKVYLRLLGGCQGCGAANVTLRGGIEKAIRALLPEITEIIDVTDHASGKNPYYKSK